MDFDRAGLLEGLDGNERAARLRLLERLAADGYTLKELKEAAAEERLALLPVERVLAGEYTAQELERMTNVSASTLLRIRRSLGLPETRPDEKTFAEADIEAARSIQKFIEAGFSEDAILEITRVLGESMARLSATAGAAFAETFLKPGESEDEVGWRFAGLAEHLTPLLEPILGAAFRAHLLANVRTTVLSRAEISAGHVVAEQELAVCFADLVGFTSLGSQLDTELLGGVVGTFGRLAAEVAEAPVRLVKTIGDAAMLVSRDPARLVDAALALVEKVAEADLPAVRAGIALGPAIPRSGDLYGHAVNVASRVTGLARPSSVLCTKEVREAADGFEWSFAGTHRLKGIGDSMPLYRARQRSEDADSADDDPANARRATRDSDAGRTTRGATKQRAGRRRR